MRFKEFNHKKRPQAVSSVTDAEITKEHWFYAYWRPAMAWQYFFVCLNDFLIQGYIFSWKYGVHVFDPVTLKGGGLYHLSMGAMLGVYMWGRNQERMEAMKQGLPVTGAGVPTPPAPPAPPTIPEPFKKNPV